MAKVALVFGGAGFIGSHLLAHLAASGAYSGLVSADIAEPRFSVEGVNYIKLDVRKPIPDDLAPGTTEIYNLAAVHTTPGHEDWEYYWTNVLGATHVSDFARRRGIDRIVFTSSIAVYGPSEARKDEDSVLEPTSAYGCSKLCAEKIHALWQAERPGERHLVVVRPAVIYGYTERGNFTRLGTLLRKGRFVFPGRTDTIKACGYVEDLVDSMRWVLDLGLPTVTYNFCHQERYTTAQICEAFSRVAGYAPAKRVIPLGPMLLGAYAFEVAGKVGLKTSINRPRIMKLVRSNNIVPKRLGELGFKYQYDLDASLEKWKLDSPSGHFD
ncbi:NAD(P)-dependent oxidoreductase [Xanthobacter flavus]|uniref:NAD-dependent epimerase/dehydratase family protein n=1 Tax=Xanthobacter flavus TaxID=281 RepID=UPI00372CBBA5